MLTFAYLEFYLIIFTSNILVCFRNIYTIVLPLTIFIFFLYNVFLSIYENTLFFHAYDPHKLNICLFLHISISIMLLHVCQFMLANFVNVMLFMQIVGFSIAVVFFALMQQAYSWDNNLRIPSMLTAVESNLTLMSHFFPLAVLPILFALFHSFFMSQPLPPFASFTSISLICYIFANGFIAILILLSHLVFFVAAVTHIFIKTRLVD